MVIEWLHGGLPFSLLLNRCQRLIIRQQYARASREAHTFEVWALAIHPDCRATKSQVVIRINIAKLSWVRLMLDCRVVPVMAALEVSQMGLGRLSESARHFLIVQHQVKKSPFH